MVNDPRISEGELHGCDMEQAIFNDWFCLHEVELETEWELLKGIEADDTKEYWEWVNMQYMDEQEK